MYMYSTSDLHIGKCLSYNEALKKTTSFFNLLCKTTSKMMENILRDVI